MILERKIKDLETYHLKRSQLEQELLDMVNQLDSSSDPKQLIEIMEYGLAREIQLITEITANNEHNPSRIKGGLYFRYYWQKQNRALAQQRRRSDEA